MPMKQSDVFRANAENCSELAEAAGADPAVQRFRRMEAAWRALAHEQDWLDGVNGADHGERDDRQADLAATHENVSGRMVPKDGR
jgi:hypothetical protein